MLLESLFSLAILTTWSAAAPPAVAAATAKRQTNVAAIDGRTATSSHVLALNVSSFILLTFIEALVMALGVATGFSGLGLFFSKGLHERSARRSLEPTDPRWMETQVNALAGGNIFCIYRTACDDPRTARLLASGVEMLLSILKATPWSSLAENSFYARMITSVRLAASVGERTPRLCKTKFPCRTRTHGS